MALGLPKKGDSRDRNGDKQNNRDMVDMVSNISLYKMTIGIFYLYVISAIFWVTTKGEKHMLYIYIYIYEPGGVHAMDSFWDKLTGNFLY